MTCDVVGLGENSVDLVYRLPVWPLPNTTTSKTRISSHGVLAGGQVITTLATCAALGLRARYAGAFGNDANGRYIRDEAAARGVDVSDAIVRDAPNRYAVILIDDLQGERVVLWDRDARLDLHGDEIRADIITAARVLHVDDTDESAAIAAARIARSAGVQVTCDVDRVSPRTEELLRSVTIPILGEHVPQALSGDADPERALRRMRGWHDGWLCVTLGTRGSMLLEGDQLHHVPAFTVHAVDTTGAGDVFRGAFVDALLRGKTPEAILRFANAAAAVSCTRAGALGGVPSRAEIEALLTRNDATQALKHREDDF
jgi:sulfofructose kinase